MIAPLTARMGLRRLALFGAAALIAACSAQVRNHGYVPTDADLDQILVGVDTKETVADVVGRPSTAGLLADGGWYYVRSQFRYAEPRAPKELSREVVAISFDKNGSVSNVERFGLDDGRVIALSRRVTEDNVQGITFLQQLFGNFGRTDPSTLLQ